VFIEEVIDEVRMIMACFLSEVSTATGFRVNTAM